MPISQTDQLFTLIKSLSKAEKRNFTVYANRIQDSDTLKYVQLFELMDKQKDLNEPQILQKLKDTDKSQYSNLKRHLYKQIMISLRMIYIQKRQILKFGNIWTLWIFCTARVYTFKVSNFWRRPKGSP
ncbi:MAG: hypothetical protein IPL23_13175 [Saprospiraceae bacterium]|nr:hypothetical protein [Saprospiraceae bacterium]